MVSLALFVFCTQTFPVKVEKFFVIVRRQPFTFIKRFFVFAALKKIESAAQN
jgi:hypothetical protein